MIEHDIVSLDSTDFILEIEKGKNDYEYRHNLIKYAKYINNLKDKSPKIEKIYENIGKTYFLDYEKKVLESIYHDIEEMNVCFHAEAYKSTVIIAGSVLEAFLIDWLSEIDGRDYFKKQFGDGTLKTYIDSIPEIKESKDLFENTNKIRDMRNIVHPRNFFKKNKKVNKNTSLQRCFSAIDRGVQT